MGLGITDRARFVYYITINLMLLFNAIASLLVLPSITLPQWKEPWGLAIGEAFNQSVTVVDTDTVGAAVGELAQDRINDLAVPE